MKIFILVLVGVFIAYILSTVFMRGCEPVKPVLPKISEEQIGPFKQYLAANGKTPEEYVKNLFLERDVVFLGNMIFFDALQVKQHIDLVIRLLPALYDKGITAVGVINVMADDQKQIDALLTAADFDEAGVRKILFNRLLISAYEEYISLFRTAWSLNNKRPANKKPVRIIGLSPKINYEYIQAKKENNEQAELDLYKKVIGDTVMDDFILDVIRKEIVKPKAKALIFIPQEYCIVRYLNKAEVKKYRKLGLEYHGSTAYQLKLELGERCFSVFLHMPWWTFKNNNFAPDYPAGGIFDLLLQGTAPEFKQRGFDIVNTPFENWVIKKSYSFNIDYMLETESGIYLKNLCDGYILLGPLSLYQSVTPIPNFINETNLVEARTRVPWPNYGVTADAEKITAEDFNKFMKAFPEFFNGVMTSFGQ